MTFKVTATYSVDVEIEIDADSKEEAISKLIKKDLTDVVNDGIVIRADSEDEQAEVIEANFDVHVTEVSYDVDYATVAGEIEDDFPQIDPATDAFDDLVYARIEEIKKELPQEMDLTIEYADPEDLEYLVGEAISDKTGWLINYCSFTITRTY